MSAFVCSSKHIAVLAQRLLQRFNGEPSVHTDEVLSVQEFAANLARLNLKSVGYRYRMTPAKACKEFAGQQSLPFIRDCQEMADSQWLWREEYSEARLWGLASCFLYQACEHPGAEKDVTYRTVQQYERVLAAACRREGKEREGWSL